MTTVKDTKAAVEEMNRVIAEFMGATVYPKKGTPEYKKWKGKRCDYESYQLEYDDSWDWLMPVYNKVNEFYINHNSNENKTAEEEFDIDRMIKLHKNVMGYLTTGNIEWTHAAIYNFITWYNQQTSPTKSGD